MNKIEEYINPTEIIDSDNPLVIDYAQSVISSHDNLIEKAVKLFYKVRDDILYDPYTPFYKPEHYKASNSIKHKRGFCVPKAALLTALGRAVGIPSRLGFATVKNHLATKQLIEKMGSNIFVYHGFTEFFLNEKWIKATPAFNKKTCEKHNIAPLEFSGYEDSIFSEYNRDNNKFMEYIAYHGSFADVPVDIIVEEWKRVYGIDRVEQYIRMFEEQHDSIPDFRDEDVWKNS